MGERNQAGNRSAGAMLRYLLGRFMEWLGLGFFGR